VYLGRVSNTKKAGELVCGDWAVESGGCEWLVSAVEPVGTTRVRITLKNEHRYMSAASEDVRVFSKTTRIRVRNSNDF
jgi:hypothetical protein